jgi:hypothetical protein
VLNRPAELLTSCVLLRPVFAVLLGTSRFTAAEHYAAALNNYTTVSTIVLILMILQLLHFLDFQPKLSLITRTVAAAWGDLVHFFILFIMVEITFTCLGA